MDIWYSDDVPMWIGGQVPCLVTC